MKRAQHVSLFDDADNHARVSRLCDGYRADIGFSETAQQFFDGLLHVGHGQRWVGEVKRGDQSERCRVVHDVANVGQARIYGVEGELVVRPTDALEIGGSFTVLDAELSEPSALLSGDVSSPIPKGARLPVSPKFKGALYAQYTVPLPSLGGEAYVRGDYSYTGESVNSIDPSIADIQHSYEIADFQLGFKREDWSVNFFLNNAFDERAELFVNPNFVSVRRITPNRPREIGVTLRKQF